MHDDIVSKLNRFFFQFPQYKEKKGNVLIQADQQPSGIFYIEEGIIRRYWITEKGEEITLNLYKPHTFLPMSWAISDVKNCHFYEAMTDVTFRKAPKQDVLSFLHEHPDILFDLLRRVYIGMEGMWKHVESLTVGNSYTKLVVGLVILGKRFGKAENNGTVISLAMTESDLANYVGMSRETTSRELHKLKEEQLVSFEKKKLTIHDITKLEQKLQA